MTRTRIEGTKRLISLRKEDLEARFPGLLQTILAAARAEPELADDPGKRQGGSRGLRPTGPARLERSQAASCLRMRAFLSCVTPESAAGLEASTAGVPSYSSTPAARA